MFDVIWYDGRIEYIRSFRSRAAALAFIAETGMDPDEFEIIEPGA